MVFGEGVPLSDGVSMTCRPVTASRPSHKRLSAERLRAAGARHAQCCRNEIAVPIKPVRALPQGRGPRPRRRARLCRAGLNRDAVDRPADSETHATLGRRDALIFVDVGRTSGSGPRRTRCRSRGISSSGRKRAGQLPNRTVDQACCPCRYAALHRSGAPLERAFVSSVP